MCWRVDWTNAGVHKILTLVTHGAKFDVAVDSLATVVVIGDLLDDAIVTMTSGAGHLVNIVKQSTAISFNQSNCENRLVELIVLLKLINLTFKYKNEYF